MPTNQGKKEKKGGTSYPVPAIWDWTETIHPISEDWRLNSNKMTYQKAFSFVSFLLAVKKDKDNDD